jgi:anti-sigma B factor antagonist
MESQGRVEGQENDGNALQPFAVASRTEGGWTVIDVRGDLDVYSSPTLRQLILDRIHRGDGRIIVDLEHVDFLDSAGASVMVSALRQATNRNGTLALVQPGDQARRMLRLTDLDKVLPTFTSVEDAVDKGLPDAGVAT